MKPARLLFISGLRRSLLHVQATAHEVSSKYIFPPCSRRSYCSCSLHLFIHPPTCLPFVTHSLDVAKSFQSACLNFTISLFHLYFSRSRSISLQLYFLAYQSGMHRYFFLMFMSSPKIVPHTSGSAVLLHGRFSFTFLGLPLFYPIIFF